MDTATIDSPTITYLLFNTSYFFSMDSLNKSVQPLDNDYEPYETTRLGTEYDAYQSSTPNLSEKSTSIDPRTDRLISRIRLVLRFISLLVSASIVGVLGHAVGVYQSTKDEFVTVKAGNISMKVWLRNMKMKPTYVLLIVASIATLLSITIIIASFSKAVRRVTNIGNLATAIVSMICTILWLVAGAYYKSDDANDAMHFNLVSYVCRHQNNEALSMQIGNMHVLCGELRYAWWAVLLMGTVELASSATVGWGMLAARKKVSYSKI
ncbi:hypothetical protein CC78DRAFT_566643 [Lojkania enalia]|uniref:Uncharacterized protein n=1 Tax=Lojkania enalia TaxID=147567 RepID=A0A9P4KCX5_9PLEO|nr:hypothetical protein CC78DRAFT_566643 [Didymosphaeria enalia]